MAPGDVCHGPRCSLAGLGPVALEYRSCHWPGGLAGSPQCVRPMGYWFFPVPRLPYVCAASWAVGLLFTGVPARFAVVRLRCPGPAGSCSPVCPLGVLSRMCGVLVKVLPWVVVGAGGLGAGKTSGAGTRGVSLDVVIGVGTGHSDTNGGESSDNRSKIHADCGPAENPSL